MYSDSLFVPKSIDELITYEHNQSLEHEFAVIIRTSCTECKPQDY